MKLVKDILTGKDNQTFDQIRVFGFIAFIGYMIFACLHVVYSHDFEYLQYAEGLGVLFAGIGGSLWAKKSTEPGN